MHPGTGPLAWFGVHAAPLDPPALDETDPPHAVHAEWFDAPGAPGAYRWWYVERVIADGHHRSAAASRVAASRGQTAGANYFLSVIFPHHQMKILDYNRVVKDLRDLDAALLQNEADQRIGGQPHH